MRSVDAPTANRDSLRVEKPAVDATLERLRQLLGVDLAIITRHGAGATSVVAISGALCDIGVLAAWQARAIGGLTPLVIANTAGNRREDGRFYAGIPMESSSGGTLLLSLVDRRPRSAAMAHQLAALAIDVTSRATIARLSAANAQYSARMDHLRRQFDRASATANIGIWECDLADNSLTWTNAVYDLFELPRGSAITREQTIACYTPASRATMEAARHQAIANCTDFTVVAEIITAKGTRRWMRLTGAVEAENGVARRIFGMKQDITEEKLLGDRTRYLAEYDVMTGLANRGMFQSRLDDLASLRQGQAIIGLLLIDLDGFKQINDTHGHALGDECLKEAAMRLSQCCGNVELVARIGGDEFAVLVGPNLTPSDIETLGGVVVEAVGRPFLRGGLRIALAASVGVAHQSSGSAEELFRRADLALYAAKAAGRNTSRVYLAA